MMKLTKEALQGYLVDGIRALAADMNAADFHFSGRMLDAFAGAAHTACAAVSSVTHAKIAAAFVALNTCRDSFRFIMQDKAEREARERAEREAREAAEREAERERAARAAELERMAAALPYITINETFLINRAEIGTDTDKAQIRRQLNRAPLFSSLSVNDIYMKRHARNYAMTGGADVLEFQAVEFSDYVERFAREARRAADAALYAEWENMDNNAKRARLYFFRNLENMRRGLSENTISAENLEALGERSPKFSKFLVKAFGERHNIVRMFNDRPKAADLGKQEPREIENRKIVISNLAANVMKMTADNAFSSCQNYTYNNFDALENLSCLPSSVNDEILSIAYLTEADENTLEPYMLGRVLLRTFEYHGKLFIFGYNAYGTTKEIISTLRAVYGTRFIYEGDSYYNGDMYQFTHDYGYEIQVSFDYEGERMCECWVCEGRGNVQAVTRYTDYHFETECPVCEGEGEIENDNPDYETFSNYPYINGSAIDFDFESCTIEVNGELLENLVSEEYKRAAGAEAEGGAA